MCSVQDKERFYLRLLLTQIRGATSYEAVRTINEIVYDSFEEAVRQLGLLDEESNEFDKCLKEAAEYKMPSQLRRLFASILLFCNLEEVDPYTLFVKYFDDFIEDIKRQVVNELDIPDDVEEFDDSTGNIIVARTLMDIEKYLIPYGKKLTDFKIPPPDYTVLQNAQRSDLMREELNYDQAELQNILANEGQLNKSQKKIYDTIIQSYNGDIEQTVFFVDGPGGYGKTFLFNMILAKVRSENEIALAVASSGIAALLLQGGRTAHSRFKIPINLFETSTLNISKQSDLANLILNTKLLIWDEAPMAHKYAFEAVDRTIRDLGGVEQPFGGMVVVMGGDFRQILPVVVRGTRSHIVDACIKSSSLWKEVQTMALTTNMRIQQQDDEEQKTFVDYLLKIGQGEEQTYDDIGEDVVKLDDSMVLEDATLESLISTIFPNLDSNYNDMANYIDYIKKRAILTTRNEQVDDINAKIINIFPGEAQEFLSADSVEDKDSVCENLYSVEFLNTLTPSGTPLHKLVLKIGVPIMLLRNISPSDGLCNGTRLIVRRLSRHIIDAEIITGSHVGKKVYIPRFRLAPSDADLPFQLIRRQFPVRVAFAMTINKSQGQTIPIVGLDLRSPVFSHGQLYVAMSRVQSKDNIHILVTNVCTDGRPGVFTKNIVYKEIL
jgi:ATP-dependent DNA helicase PIF1